MLHFIQDWLVHSRPKSAIRLILRHTRSKVLERLVWLVLTRSGAFLQTGIAAKKESEGAQSLHRSSVSYYAVINGDSLNKYVKRNILVKFYTFTKMRRHLVLGCSILQREASISLQNLQYNKFCNPNLQYNCSSLCPAELHLNMQQLFHWTDFICIFSYFTLVMNRD